MITIQDFVDACAALTPEPQKRKEYVIWVSPFMFSVAVDSFNKNEGIIQKHGDDYYWRGMKLIVYNPEKFPQ